MTAELRDSLAQVQGLLGRATPGPWSAWYSGRGNMRFRHISATAPAIPGFCGERPIDLANLAVISEETDAANAALIVAAVNLVKEHGPELMKMLDRHGAGDAEEGSLRFIAKRNLRKMIEIGSTDTKTMLLCLEELS